MPMPKKEDEIKVKRRDITVNDLDWEAWRQAAEKEGLSRSAWIRHVCNAMAGVNLGKIALQANEEGVTVRELVERLIEG